jgi:hypothetical protein
MSTKESILEALRSRKKEFSKLGIKHIGLFGSYIKNEQVADSDIDVLIELENNTANVFDVKWALREFLKAKFNRDVDLCNTKHIKPFAKNFIPKDAIYA